MNKEKLLREAEYADIAVLCEKASKSDYRN